MSSPGCTSIGYRSLFIFAILVTKGSPLGYYKIYLAISTVKLALHWGRLHRSVAD